VTPQLGYFTFVLHSHLPYVLRHGKWPHGSDWLMEAVAECYLPLLRVLTKLEKNKIPAKLSMDFSPILLEQLAAPEFPKLFIDYCNEKIDLAEKDHAYFFENDEVHLRPLALFWHEFYTELKREFLYDINSDIISAFKHFVVTGALDAMTCGATHGYFPLLGSDASIRAQIELGIATHERHFGVKPRGIWLPECGYRPRYEWSAPIGPEEFKNRKTKRAGIEEILSEFGLEYFIVEGSLTKGGTALGSYFQLFDMFKNELISEEEWNAMKVQYFTHDDRSLSDVYAVKSTTRELPGNPPIVFSRDRKTSEQVWSGEIGYPGDPSYLEFHKKHHKSGLRYWAVTSAKIDLGKKKVYDPSTISKRVSENAEHFITLVKETLAEHKAKKGYCGIVCSPFDTELFGHWWFEGPEFIYNVIEKLQADKDVALTNCVEYLDTRKEPIEIIALPEGSWGEGGGHFVWSNHEVAWMWDHIYPAEERFLELLHRYKIHEKTDFMEKVFEQSARELLLLESSDWQFIITTKGAPDYSRERFHDHSRVLTQLLDLAERTLDSITPDEHDRELLELSRSNDFIFDEINLNWWK
jgi:1,4-alpha-glucan branching enzyme